MKKYFLTAALMLSLVTLAKYVYGENLVTPRGDAQALATADYGGVYVSTQQFSVVLTTVCSPCYGVVYGAFFSSGSGVNLTATPDFVDVFDSTMPFANPGQANAARLARFYSGALSVSSSTVSGFSGPPKPFRFSQGLRWQTNNAALNIVNLLYYTPRKDDN